MMMSMAIQDVYGRYMMFKDWPRGAALWWRRIPTATSGRAVRESDRMLLGSAHAVPTHEDVHKMCSHVPSGAALQEPAGGGPRTRREHRRGARASPPTQRWWWRLRRRRHAAGRRRRRRWGGRSRGLHRGERVRRSVGEESQPKHVNVLSEKVILIGSSHADLKHCDCAKGEFWLKVPHLYKYRQYTGEQNVHQTHFPYSHDPSTVFTTSSICRFLPLQNWK